MPILSSFISSYSSLRLRRQKCIWQKPLPSLHWLQFHCAHLASTFPLLHHLNLQCDLLQHLLLLYLYHMGKKIFPMQHPSGHYIPGATFAVSASHQKQLYRDLYRTLASMHVRAGWTFDSFQY